MEKGRNLVEVLNYDAVVELFDQDKIIERLDQDKIVQDSIDRKVHSKVYKKEIIDRVISAPAGYLGISDAASTPCAQAMLLFFIFHLAGYKPGKRMSALLNASLFGMWAYFYGQHDVLGSPLHFLMLGLGIYSLARHKLDWKSALAAGLINVVYYVACLPFIKYGLPIDFW